MLLIKFKGSLWCPGGALRQQIDEQLVETIKSWASHQRDHRAEFVRLFGFEPDEIERRFAAITSVGALLTALGLE